MFLLGCICPDYPRDTLARSDASAPRSQGKSCIFRSGDPTHLVGGGVREKQKLAVRRIGIPGARSVRNGVMWRGKSAERVTEGEQGKYRRIGALWKHLSEGRLYKDADATTRQWHRNLPLAMLPAAKAKSGWTARSSDSHRPPHPAMRGASAGATESKASCALSVTDRREQE